MTADELLDLLVCPVCRGALTPVPDRKALEGLSCPACEKVYPVRDGIPVMLADEAVSATRWSEGARDAKGGRR